MKSCSYTLEQLDIAR